MSLCLTFEAHIVVFSETSICTVSFCTAGGLQSWETPHHLDCFHSTHLPFSFLRISDKEGGPDYEVLASIWPMAITFCFRVVRLNISASSLAVTVCLCIIASIIVASSKERAKILHLVTIVIVHWHLERCRAWLRRVPVPQTAANFQQCAVYSDTPLEVPSLKTRLTEKVTRTEVEVLIPSRDEALEPTHLCCVFYHTCNRAE